RGLRCAGGGARRPAVPDRLPRNARGRGGPVHAGRRRPGDLREADPATPPRVRGRRGLVRRRGGGPLGAAQEGGEGPRERHGGHPGGAAGAALRVEGAEEGRVAGRRLARPHRSGRRPSDRPLGRGPRPVVDRLPPPRVGRRGPSPRRGPRDRAPHRRRAPARPVPRPGTLTPSRPTGSRPDSPFTRSRAPGARLRRANGLTRTPTLPPGVGGNVTQRSNRSNRSTCRALSTSWAARSS